jgi:hypothetical protein
VQKEEEMKVPRIISCKVRKTKQSCVYNWKEKQMK